jgi:tetratricopeptide (TPR) repeat protein
MCRLTGVVLVAGLLAAGCGRSSSPPPSNAGAAAPDAGASAGSHASDHKGPPQSIADWARGAKLFDRLGTFHRTVTTSSADAQRYFDQGMRLLWAFNHDESTRSFAKATLLDPACAMCYWGVALTVGPNYNLPVMAAPRAKVAWDALRLAQQHAPRATSVEQALVGALGRRYAGPQPLDPSTSQPVLVAYANAMRDVAKSYPRDHDVQVLFAESLMNTNPWRLWTNDGQPAPGTAEIETTLERVLASDPGHPGANHYYVHTMEASPHPERALAAADRLNGMMPDAGHLQHMPAHVLQRVGRYEEAAQANRAGVVADVAYLGATPPLDYYTMYFAHNYQFLAYSAAMEGRRAEALDAAKKMRDAMPVDMLLMMPGADWALSEVYATMIRFGDWDAILAERAPDVRLTALTGGYHFARTLALAGKGRLDDAKGELGRLQSTSADLPADAAAGLNSARDVFAVAVLVAQGEILSASGRIEEAAARLREAAAKEDQLGYDEPADWFVPVRHQLGAVLLRAGHAPEAEAVYRQDLAQHPHNGWALFGLASALRAEHKAAAAAAVDREFAAAWAKADVMLTGSVF